MMQKIIGFINVKAHIIVGLYETAKLL